MAAPTTASIPALRRLASIFLRIVNLTFGGGEPTMAALYRELVGRRKWLAPGDYGLAYALARLTPGTNLLALCAGVAWMLRGWHGAILCVVAGTVPSAALVVWLTYGYGAVKDSPYAAGAVAGTLAGAVGMMVAAAWQLARPGLRRGAWPRTLLLAFGSAGLLLFSPMSPIQVLGLAAAIGAFWPGGES